MSEPNKPEPRAALRQAIVERDRAKEAVALARAALDAGKALRAAEERKLHGFDDVEDAIVAHRASSYKSAAQGGPKPTLELPSELLRRERLRDEAKAAFRAAKVAAASLADDLARVEGVLGRAERRVSELACQILVTAAVARGSELAAIWNALWATIDELNSLRAAFPVQLPRTLIASLQRFAAFDHRQFPGNFNAGLRLAGERWRSWHAALCRNAEAEMPQEPLGDRAPPELGQRVA